MIRTAVSAFHYRLARIDSIVIMKGLVLSLTVMLVCMCMCVYVCVCICACARACVRGRKCRGLRWSNEYTRNKEETIITLIPNHNISKQSLRTWFHLVKTRTLTHLFYTFSQLKKPSLMYLILHFTSPHLSERPYQHLASHNDYHAIVGRQVVFSKDPGAVAS
jgi:hypothetical protein